MTAELVHMTAPEPAIGISIQVDVAKGRAMVFQTHIGRDVSLAELNALLDRMNVAADRQLAIYELEALDFQLRHDQRILEQCTTDFFAIEARVQHEWNNDPRRRGSLKLTAKEEQEKKNAESMIARMKAQIAATEQKIKDYTVKIGERKAA